MSTPGQPAGWYPDPSGQGQRYWTGSEWGPSAPAGGPPPEPGRRGRRRGRGCLTTVLAAIGLIVVIVIVVVVVALSSASKSTPGSGTSSHPAANDITVTSCTVDTALNMPTATGTIVNHSSGTSNYSFTVSFLNSAGTVVAQGAGLESNIAAQQSATWTATGDQQTSGPVTCRIVNVTRYASG